MTTNNRNFPDDEDPDDAIQEGLEEFGKVTGHSADPLQGKEYVFEQASADPYDLYLMVKKRDDITDEVYKQWENCFDEWQDFMAAQNRHPACASEQHVSKYVRWHLTDLGHTEGHVKGQLYKLNAAYEWMLTQAVFDLPTNYNPYRYWLQKGRLKAVTKRNYPRITENELRERINGVTNVRERAYFVCLLKWGCRAGELCNIRLPEISIDHPDLQDHYEEMGSHPEVEDLTNVVFIPRNRKGNKRKVNTVLPLDEEVRQVLVDWLLIRPDNGKEELFFTDKGKALDKGSLRYSWKKYWGDMYFDEDSDYDNVSPHWARHYYTTWWANTDLPKAKRKYLRGDKTDENNDSEGALDLYTHIEYEDIKDEYLAKIFQFRLTQP